MAPLLIFVCKLNYIVKVLSRFAAENELQTDGDQPLSMQMGQSSLSLKSDFGIWLFQCQTLLYLQNFHISMGCCNLRRLHSKVHALMVPTIWQQLGKMFLGCFVEDAIWFLVMKSKIILKWCLRPYWLRVDLKIFSLLEAGITTSPWTAFKLTTVIISLQITSTNCSMAEINLL